MPNEDWNRLVDAVLTGVEPDEAARAQLRAALRRAGHLGDLYSLWKTGADAAQVGRTIRRLSEQFRAQSGEGG